MQITTITVRYGRTQSLNDYCNIRPEVSLTAELAAGDDPEDVRNALFIEARRLVEAECDEALEADGQPAKFDPTPRYTVIRSRAKRWPGSDEPIIEPPVVAIIPADTRVPDGYGRVQAGVRLHHASRIAAESAESYNITQPIIFCTDGDLSRLPTLPPEPLPLPLPFEPALADHTDEMALDEYND